MDAMELSECFRQLGLAAPMDEIRSYVCRVDKDGNNTVDFREFLRVMRLHREKVLRVVRIEFFSRKDAATQLLPRHRLEEALMAVGYDKDDIRGSGLPSCSLDFDTFVGLCDSMRKALLIKDRKKAWFSDAELKHFRSVFDTFDKDNTGMINTMGLIGILTVFGWEPKSREAQAELLKKLDGARAAARSAGIVDVGLDGSSTIRFWSFVQLARTLYNERDKACEEALALLTEELDFTQKEVEEFRHVFRTWYERIHGDESIRSSTDTLSLPCDVVKRIVRSLAVKLSPDTTRQLDDKLQSLQRDADGVYFDGFLRLMRWLLDIDFGGISHRPESKE